MTTAQTRATNATNSFIADYCERHGENQATRTEAYDRIAELEGMADLVRQLTDKCAADDQQWVSDGILANLFYEEGERYVATCMVAALREKEVERMEISA